MAEGNGDSPVWVQRLHNKGEGAPKGTVLKVSTPAQKRRGKSNYKPKK